MNKANLKIETNINEVQIGELIEFSTNDNEVVKYTSDSKRFKDRPAFDAWMQDNPSLYVLTDNTLKLLGIAWVQKMPCPLHQPEFKTTAAIRLYGKARGKGLSKWFLREVLNRYGPSNYWLRTSSDNIGAIKTYERLGFNIVSSPDKENKIILTRHSSFGSLQ